MADEKKRRGPKTTIPINAKRRTLKACRNELGSCQEVASKFGVTSSAVRKMEDGISTPNLLTAFKYSLLFNKTLEELFPDLIKQAKECMSID
jgi:DNA-binding XRE family transcriptional regulator